MTCVLSWARREVGTAWTWREVGTASGGHGLSTAYGGAFEVSPLLSTFRVLKTSVRALSLSASMREISNMDGCEATRDRLEQPIVSSSSSGV